MTTATPVMLAFRCTRCWQSNVTESDQCGSEVPCRHCGHTLIVPDATPQRIALAEEVSQSLAKQPPSGQLFQDSLPSDRELNELVKQEFYCPAGSTRFFPLPGSVDSFQADCRNYRRSAAHRFAWTGIMADVYVVPQSLARNPSHALRSSQSWDATTIMLIVSLAAMLCLGQWMLLACADKRSARC